MEQKKLKEFLDRKVEEYNQSSFIKDDPISIPHSFNKKQDIEISGFFAAIFAWGNRTTIINKTKELVQLMDNAPHQFCLHHKESDLKKLLGFKHRTFNTTDLLYFIQFFKYHYSKNNSLESAFSKWMNKKDENIEKGLNGFYYYFFPCPMHRPGQKNILLLPKKFNLQAIEYVSALDGAERQVRR